MTTPAAPPDLLELLRCPLCGARLEERDDGLGCTGCGRSFAIEDEIPLLVHDDLPGVREKLRESAGWVEKARREGWYEPDDEAEAKLPEADWNELSWFANRHSFQVLLDRYVEPGMRVLEVGAAKCWGAPHLLARGCEYVGTDMLVDANIGLRRGRFYEELAGRPFARVQADGEHLPFPDGSFDLTYCVATLHHALDLSRMVKELARVTRPRGIVAALNEGTRGLRASRDSPQQREERELGINEHVHTAWTYAAAFARAGLTLRRAERADGYTPPGLGGVLVRLPKVGTTLGTLIHLSSGGYAGISIYARKRARGS